jgi:hypothetical protein
MATFGISHHLLLGFVVGFVNAQQLAKDVAQDPAVAEVRSLGGGADPHRRREVRSGGCGNRLMPFLPAGRETGGRLPIGRA